MVRLLKLLKVTSATVVEIAYLNTEIYTGELVTFKESNIVTNLGVTTGSYLNITSSYTLDKGQRHQRSVIFSRLIRKDMHKSSKSKIKNYFESLYCSKLMIKVMFIQLDHMMRIDSRMIFQYSMIMNKSNRHTRL